MTHFEKFLRFLDIDKFNPKFQFSGKIEFLRFSRKLKNNRDYDNFAFKK